MESNKQELIKLKNDFNFRSLKTVEMIRSIIEVKANSGFLHKGIWYMGFLLHGNIHVMQQTAYLKQMYFM